MVDWDWRYNFDIDIIPRDVPLPRGYVSQGYVCLGWTGNSKTIHLGTKYLTSLIRKEYKENICDLITHEIIHLILIKKIDYSEKWVHPRLGIKWWASRGFDFIDKKYNITEIFLS